MLKFDLQLPVTYTLLMKHGPSLASGTGTTVSISRSGVIFRAQRAIPAHTPVELTIEWPVLLEGKHPLSLEVYGDVRKSDNSVTSVSIKGYEFRRRRG